MFNMIILCRTKSVNENFIYCEFYLSSSYSSEVVCILNGLGHLGCYNPKYGHSGLVSESKILYGFWDKPRMTEKVSGPAYL
jgi:hypothetical protein